MSSKYSKKSGQASFEIHCRPVVCYVFYDLDSLMKTLSYMSNPKCECTCIDSEHFCEICDEVWWWQLCTGGDSCGCGKSDRPWAWVVHGEHQFRS